MLWACGFQKCFKRGPLRAGVPGVMGLSAWMAASAHVVHERNHNHWHACPKIRRSFACHRCISECGSVGACCDHSVGAQHNYAPIFCGDFSMSGLAHLLSSDVSHLLSRSHGFKTAQFDSLSVVGKRGPGCAGVPGSFTSAMK